MKNLSSATRIGTDTGYLNGNLIDGQTLLDTAVLQDMIQFFQKLKAKAAITENGLFDNETNGYQLVEALDKRNYSTHLTKIGGVFQLNYAMDLTAGQTMDVNYDFSQNLSYGRFIGLSSRKPTDTLTQFDILSSTTNLTTGLILVNDTNLIVTAYNNKIRFF